MKLRTGVEIALFLVVFGMGASMLWTHLHPPAAPSAQFTPAPPIPQAAEIKVVTVPGPPQIVTVEKQTVVRDLKLPDAIAKDPDKQVTATAQVNAGDGNKVDAVSVIDTKTGQSTIETKEERPFFAFLSQKEAGIRAGIGIHGPEGGLYGRWTFARTGAIQLGGLWRCERSCKPTADNGGSSTGERAGYAGCELQVVRVSATA
jgi:hypothetical protein